MEKLTVSDILPMFGQIGRLMEDQRETLTRLDAEMGDGDLGLTMTKAFRLLSSLDVEEGDSMGTLFVKAGKKLASGVPSTMGTLMASGFLEGGKELLGNDSMGAAEFVIFLEGFCRGVAKRGKCQPGDRTVLDAVEAAAREASLACKAERGRRLEEIAKCAFNGAKAGAERTKDMYPRFGKAFVHREKAIGKMDQGAYAGALFIEGIYNYTTNMNQG